MLKIDLLNCDLLFYKPSHGNHDNCYLNTNLTTSKFFKKKDFIRKKVSWKRYKAKILRNNFFIKNL